MEVQVLTQLNITIALGDTRDSYQMRTIAFLTMFFLPVTSVAVCDIHTPDAFAMSFTDRPPLGDHLLHERV